MTERFLTAYSFIPRNAVEVSDTVGGVDAMRRLMALTPSELKDKLRNVRPVQRGQDMRHPSNPAVVAQVQLVQAMALGRNQMLLAEALEP